MTDNFELAVKMGRYGVKIHPALAEKDERGKFVNVHPICSCPNTQRGGVYISVIKEGFGLVNCGAKGE